MTLHIAASRTAAVAAVLLGLLAGCAAPGDDSTSTSDSRDGLDMPEAPSETHEPILVRDEQVELFQYDALVGRDGEPPQVDLLHDGALLRVVEGYQQANMVVVGLRTEAAFAEPIDVRLRLEADGQRHSEVTWAFQRFHPTTDGAWRSMYDLYLVLDGCKRFEEGSPGALTVTVTDKHGNTYERRIEVALERNDLC